MPVAVESVENFRRAAPHDSLLGVYDTGSEQIYLALVQHRNNPSPLMVTQRTEITADRHSWINGVKRQPLPGAGGHSQLAQWAGIDAQQLRGGLAVGPCYGFSITKTGPSKFVIGTLRSGFNQFYQGDRPEGSTSRTLPNHAAFNAESEDRITLLPTYRGEGYHLETCDIAQLMGELTKLIDASREEKDQRRSRSV